MVHRQEKNLLFIGIRLHQVFEVTERYKRYILSLTYEEKNNEHRLKCSVFRVQLLVSNVMSLL